MNLLSACAAIVICLQLGQASAASNKFDCTGLANGDYKDPNVACSQWYWVCMNGAASIKFCDDTKAYYAINDTCISTKAMPECGLFTEDINFDCVQKSDGDYANNASICSQISGVSCKGGVRSVHYCGATARFDILSQRCLFPKHMSSCGGNDVILPSDVLPTQPPQRQLQFDCLKKVGNFPNPDASCSNLFVICGSGGFPSTGTCPATTVYDADNNWCQYPQYVLACGGHPSTTTTMMTMTMPTTTTMGTTMGTTTASAPSGAAPFSCDGLDVGYYADPAQPCSTFYYACTGLKSGIKEQCALGTYWDRVLMMCTWHDNIPECGGVRPNASIHARSANPMPVGTGAAPISFNCTGLKTGNYPDPSLACSRFFYTCSLAGTPFQQTCPINTWYDKDLDECNFYALIPECSGTPRPTTIPTTLPTTISALPSVPTTTQAPPAATGPTPIFVCTGLKAGNYPDPSQACSSSFYTCTLAGTPFKQTCPPSTWYDKDLDECNFYSMVPECSGTPRPTTISTRPPPPGATSPMTTAVPFDCTKKQSRNYLPTGVLCSDFFWECANGIAFKQNCPPGLKYDEYSDQCLQETDVIGCPKYIPRSQFCASKPVSGVYAYPGQCSSYVWCIGGIEAVLTCPTGTVWNARDNQCDETDKVSPPCGTGSNPAPMTCVSQAPGTYGSPNDCSVYITCTATSSTVSRCPEGSAFNQITSTCVPAYQLPQCFPPVKDDLAKFCADLPDGIYAFPGNCRRALFCLMKKAYVYYCTDSAAPYWDPIAHTCSAPTQTCTSSTKL